MSKISNLTTRPLDAARRLVRRGAHSIAKFLNRISGGRITPDSVTYTSLLGHVLIALLLANRHVLWAVLLLVVFGLMDTLDGELARLQKRASTAGMLLDASTDRMKESLIYTAAAYYFVQQGHPLLAVWAVAATAGAILVSYIKAKGETAVASHGADHAAVNHLFADGLMRYEIRMVVIIIGLLVGQLGWAIILLAILSWLTAFGRLARITSYLRNAS
ncbi:MAG: CDP-alcohol phosphatidyltransferase family protein [Candidatus Saccharimonadales bacterium]